MTWLDAIVLLPLLIGLVLGLTRGVVTEVFTILSVVGGVIGARIWAAPFSQWMQQQVSWAPSICDVIGYALLFLAIAIALSIVGRLLSKLLKAIRLGIVNRLLGGLFGACKWGLIVLLLVFCFNKLDSQFGILKADIKKNSVVYNGAITLSQQCLTAIQVQITE